MYIYRYLFIYSPRRRSFRGTGGFARGLDLGGWAKICAWELASVAPRCLQPPGASIAGSRVLESFQQKSVFDQQSHFFETQIKFSSNI